MTNSFLRGFLTWMAFSITAATAVNLKELGWFYVQIAQAISLFLVLIAFKLK